MPVGISDGDIPLVVQEINFCLRNRIFESAFILCDELFSFKQDVESLALYAQTYLQSGSPKLGSLLLQKYARITYQSPELMFLNAQMLFESGEYTSSEEILNNLMKLPINPNTAEFLTAGRYLLGKIKLRTHRFSSAKTDFTQILKEKPLLVSAIEYIKYDLSENNIEEPPIHLASHQLLASNEEDYDNIEFEEYYKKSILLQSKRATHLFNMAKYESAAHLYRDIYMNHPYSVIDADKFSTCLWQLKKNTEIKVLINRLTKIAPNKAETWIAAGNGLSLQGRTEEAIKMFSRAASLDRSKSYALTLAGHEYLSLEMNDKAEPLFREALNRNPLDFSAWFGLGTSLYRENKFGAARYYLMKATLINPKSSILKFCFAMIEEKCDNVDAAAALLDEAIELDPNNLLAKYQRAQFFFKAGQYDEAREILSDLAAFVPKEPGVRFHQAEIEALVGNKETALRYYIDALVYGYSERQVVADRIKMMTNDESAPQE